MVLRAFLLKRKPEALVNPFRCLASIPDKSKFREVDPNTIALAQLENTPMMMPSREMVYLVSWHG